ncbi:MAG: glutamate racemase [Bacteroidales bacterium]|nr:glutamate racemase [Bacteroidales bacterium]
MQANKPIGIFDSGVGGLSVFKELIKSLPSEDVLYFADTANCPYGSKSNIEVIELSKKIVDFLINKNCKTIIVACNTATAAAIDYLRSNYEIPFIGMEPAVKPAALNSKSKSIAVLATEGTFNGRLYIETSQKYAKDVNLNVKVGNRLVSIVENDLINEPETKKYIQELLNPLIAANIDHLVLGCTHYPFLIPVLKDILPDNVEIIDPALAVVAQLKRILIKHNLINSKTEGQYDFYSSGNSSILEKMVSKILKFDFRVNNYSI